MVNEEFNIIIIYGFMAWPKWTNYASFGMA